MLPRLSKEKPFEILEGVGSEATAETDQSPVEIVAISSKESSKTNISKTQEYKFLEFNLSKENLSRISLNTKNTPLSLAELSKNFPKLRSLGFPDDKIIDIYEKNLNVINLNLLNAVVYKAGVLIRVGFSKDEIITICLKIGEASKNKIITLVNYFGNYGFSKQDFVALLEACPPEEKSCSAHDFWYLVQSLSHSPPEALKKFQDPEFIKSFVGSLKGDNFFQILCDHGFTNESASLEYNKFKSKTTKSLIQIVMKKIEEPSLPPTKKRQADYEISQKNSKRVKETSGSLENPIQITENEILGSKDLTPNFAENILTPNPDLSGLKEDINPNNALLCFQEPDLSLNLEEILTSIGNPSDPIFAPLELSPSAKDRSISFPHQFNNRAAFFSSRQANLDEDKKNLIGGILNDLNFLSASKDLRINVEIFGQSIKSLFDKLMELFSIQEKLLFQQCPFQAIASIPEDEEIVTSLSSFFPNLNYPPHIQLLNSLLPLYAEGSIERKMLTMLNEILQPNSEASLNNYFIY